MLTYLIVLLRLNMPLFNYQLPIPKAPWSGIREAKKPGPYCLQFNLLRPRIMGSENCLYLNVYTPQVKIIQPVSLEFCPLHYAIII
jgi:hypothetical protein